MEQLVIYTDGHGIKVTSTEFITHKANYLIAGISDVRMHLIKASKTPGILLIVLGIIGMVAGAMHLLSTVDIPPSYVGNILMTPNRLVFAIGAVLLLLGVLLVVLMRDKYAVKILTAEGEKEPVVSPRQDYINQIVTAVQNAVLHYG